MQSRRPQLRLLAFLLCASFAFPYAAQPAWAQTRAPAPTPVPLRPDAQDAFDHGLAAAKQVDWNLAIRYFLDAQKADPNASQIWFNLGLASSKLPGDEFRAIAWFKAYLLANPNADSAAAVNEQVTQLEVVFESRLMRLVDALEQISRGGMDQAISGMGRHPDISTDFNPAELGGMFAAMRLYLGDVSGANKTLVSFGVMPLESQMRQPDRVMNCRVQESHAPEHFRLAAASAGFAIICFGAGTSATPRARGTVDDAKSAAGLLIRARDGEVLTVRPFWDSDQAPKKLECDETQLGVFVDAIRQNLQLPQLLESNNGYYREAGLINSLNSLANLLASYRQMRGPYDH